jgi:hypothetical protein
MPNGRFHIPTVEKILEVFPHLKWGNPQSEKLKAKPIIPNENEVKCDVVASDAGMESKEAEVETNQKQKEKVGWSHVAYFDDSPMKSAFAAKCYEYIAKNLDDIGVLCRDSLVILLFCMIMLLLLLLLLLLSLLLLLLLSFFEFLLSFLILLLRHPLTPRSRLASGWRCAARGLRGGHLPDLCRVLCQVWAAAVGIPRAALERHALACRNAEPVTRC